MKLEPLTIITVDNVPVSVADLPEELQSAVRIYDEVRQREHDARIELAVATAAGRSVAADLTAAIRELRQKAAEQQAAKATPPTDAPAASTPQAADDTDAIVAEVNAESGNDAS